MQSHVISTTYVTRCQRVLGARLEDSDAFVSDESEKSDFSDSVLEHLSQPALPVPSAL
jgi:hypothetical protein